MINSNDSSIKSAINFEIKGTNLYLDLAKKTKNLLAKKLFYSLAKQEIDHAERFEEIFTQIDNEKGQEGLKSEQFQDIESEIKTYFMNTKKSDLKKDADNISGYKTAMKMEKESYEVYKKLRDRSQSENEKLFFTQLMKEEMLHLEALQNVYTYITAPGDWMQEDESKQWNWMNM
ncbi:ferritin family protein [Elusimicrobiota bacterium]